MPATASVRPVPVPAVADGRRGVPAQGARLSCRQFRKWLHIKKNKRGNVRITIGRGNSHTGRLPPGPYRMGTLAFVLLLPASLAAFATAPAAAADTTPKTVVYLGATV